MAKRHRILIVEDESLVAYYMKETLEKLNYDVSGIAATGEDGIRMAIEQQPDLILMDIKLKGKMNGIEAAQEIQGTSDVPIVYVTAYVDDELIERAKAAKPFGYIVKPLKGGDMRSNIEIALYKHAEEVKTKRALDTCKRMNKLMTGRELRMAEMKKELQHLRKKTSELAKKMD